MNSRWVWAKAAGDAPPRSQWQRLYPITALWKRLPGAASERKSFLAQVQLFSMMDMIFSDLRPVLARYFQGKWSYLREWPHLPRYQEFIISVSTARIVVCLSAGTAANGTSPATLEIVCTPVVFVCCCLLRRFA